MDMDKNKMISVDLFRESGRRGGLATKKKRGKEWYAKIGARGGAKGKGKLKPRSVGQEVV